MHNPLATMVRVATSEEHNFSNYFIPFVCGCLSFQLYISKTFPFFFWGGRGRCFFFDGILPANVWWNLIFWVPRSWFIHPPLGWPKKGRTKKQGHDVWGFIRWKRKCYTPSCGVGLIRETYKVGVSFFFVILVEWFFILVTSPPQKNARDELLGIQGETLLLFQVVTFLSPNVGGHDSNLPKWSFRSPSLKGHVGRIARMMHPWKLTCPLKRDYFNRKYIFQPLIFRGHVSFRGSDCFLGPLTRSSPPTSWVNLW